MLLALGCTLVLVDEPCPPERPFSDFAAGGLFSCGVDEGISCWGRADEGQLDAPAGAPTLLAAGYAHGCAQIEGELRCWGRDDFGQASPPAVEAVALAAGGGHSCALSAGGLQCWGRDDLGQASFAPTGEFLAVAAGSLDSCVLDAAGLVRCASGWTRAGASALSVGRDHHCVLVDGGAECDGLEAPAGAFTALASGADFACGLDLDGEVACWGELAEAPPAGPFLAIDADANGAHACALDEAGWLRCWGDDGAGQASVPQ